MSSAEVGAGLDAVSSFHVEKKIFRAGVLVGQTKKFMADSN